jgi:O-antigen/teichoic acid export membrane protein
MAVALPQLCVHAALLAWAHRPPSPWARPDRQAFAQLFRGTGPLALWTVCGILIGGVDIFIVRVVDPSEVARYAVALPLLAVPTGVVTAAVTAWMPRITQAESARTQGGREPTLIGTTLLVAGLSIGALAFVGGADGLVRLLAGSGQWRAAVGYLQLLYLATALRFAMLPYVVLIVVRGEQGKLMLSPVAEAATNVVASVVLGLAFGAVGVALGTLGGAVVGVAAHLVRSVRRTVATGLTSSDLLAAAARAWPTVAAATVLGALAVGRASWPWRGVAAVVAVAVDGWWLLDHARSMRAPFAPLEVVPER